jgi:probable phosphoglycerate mutase
MRKRPVESGGMRLYFARHGESEANLRHIISNRELPHGLTHKGRLQAGALARRLEAAAITCIYTSPVPRALETAAILANRLGIEYKVEQALREYDCGVAEGRSDEDTWRMWQELREAWLVHQRWEERIEGGESFNDLRERLLPFIEALIGRYRETEAGVLCISHGGLYTMMLPLVLKNAAALGIARGGFDYTTCLVAELRGTGLFGIE